jgi:hypothetical protein
MAISRRRPAKRVSKKITQKRYRYPFELKVKCNFSQVDKEDWIDVEDVSKLPKKIKDRFNTALFKLQTESSNHTDFTKVVYGKGKDYISLVGYAEHPIDDDMSGDGTLGFWIEVVNDKRIWQYFGNMPPTHAGKEYKFSSICLTKPKELKKKDSFYWTGTDYCY